MVSSSQTLFNKPGCSSRSSSQGSALIFATVMVIAVSLPQMVVGGALFDSAKPIFTSPSAYKILYKGGGPSDSPVIIKSPTTGFSNSIVPTIVATFQPCGVIGAHTHPRATETVYIISGSIEVGMFLEDGTCRIVKAKAGEGIVIPEGTVHYVRNAGCSKAVITATLDNPNPGTVFVGQALLKFPAAVLNGAFTVSPPKGDSPAIFQIKPCSCNSGYSG